MKCGYVVCVGDDGVRMTLTRSHVVREGQEGVRDDDDSCCLCLCIFLSFPAPDTLMLPRSCASACPLPLVPLLSSLSLVLCLRMRAQREIEREKETGSESWRRRRIEILSLPNPAAPAFVDPLAHTHTHRLTHIHEGRSLGVLLPNSGADAALTRLRSLSRDVSLRHTMLHTARFTSGKREKHETRELLS